MYIRVVIEEFRFRTMPNQEKNTIFLTNFFGNAAIAPPPPSLYNTETESMLN